MVHKTCTARTMTVSNIIFLSNSHKSRVMRRNLNKTLCSNYVFIFDHSRTSYHSPLCFVRCWIYTITTAGASNKGEGLVQLNEMETVFVLGVNVVCERIIMISVGMEIMSKRAVSMRMVRASCGLLEPQKTKSPSKNSFISHLSVKLESRRF